MANYRDIYKKKKSNSNVQYESSFHKEADHQSVYVKRKKDASRIQTPLDPAELSSEDRKLLLEKRIAQLEENEKYISNIQLEMANSFREKSRTSYNSLSTGSRRPSDSDTCIISRDSYETERKASFSNMPIPEDEIDTTNYDKYRYLSDVKTGGVQNVRKADRNYRISVRSKAERLLMERRIRSRGRKRAAVIRNTEQMLKERNTGDYSPGFSDSENQVEQNRIPRPRDQYLPNVDNRSRSPRSDDEFVEVPEYVESDTSSVYAYSLPPPRTRKSMRSDIPSVVQVSIVNDRLRSNVSFSLFISTVS